MSDRQRAEDALRESDARYRLLFRHMLDGFAYCRMLFDERGRPADFIYLDVNDSFATLTGLNDVIGKRATEVLPGIRSSNPELFEIYGRVASSGRPEKFEIYLEVLEQWFSVAVYSPQKGHFAAVFDNITARKRGEKQLERSRHGLSRLAEASLRIMRQTDLDAMLQEISETARELTGARIAVCGHGYAGGRFVVGAATRAPGTAACPSGKGLAIDKGGIYMELVEGAGGTIRLTDEQLRAHPRWWGLPEGHVPLRGLLGVRLVDRQGRTNGVILVTDKERGEFTAEDESMLVQLGTLGSLASQHVEARISLEEADRGKNQFLAMLSHELRNPLTPIRHGLYLLERAAPGGEQAQWAKEVIKRQVAQLSRLVDDLLEVTRFAHGKIRLQTELLDMSEVVRAALEDYRALFEKNRLGLECSIADEPMRVSADRTRLAQVIGNILGNAAKFTPPGGKVSISVHCDGALGQAIVRVRDTGPGIAPEMLARIFDPFTQLDATLERSKGGLGLGLALVKGITEMHGGSASAQSDGPGKGAEFSLRFPLAAGPAPAPER